MYFPKTTIQRIFSCYNYCLFKLLRINTVAVDHNQFNNKLDIKYNLKSFVHRLVVKTTTFAHKIMNQALAPSLLKSCLALNKDVSHKHTYELRNLDQVNEKSKLYNHFGELTFSYFFPKLINKLILNDISLNFSMFKTRICNNINILFDKFVKTFPKFDLSFYS